MIRTFIQTNYIKKLKINIQTNNKIAQKFRPSLDHGHSQIEHTITN